jgi:hypothetical protein
VSGEQGSAKTVLSKVLRAPVRTMPREERDLFIAASNGHLLAFDNLSDIPARTSDALCRLASMGSFAIRQLYTDADEALFQAACPTILNGIEDVITRPDLADRAIFLTLPYVHDTRRRPEKEIDAWWVERRLLAPKLLDTNAAPKAYRIVPDAAPPTKENLRVEHEFTAGWIAHRFLKEPAAARHFARITGISNPIALARAGYWRGRAADAMNKRQEAGAPYEQAARYGTNYYGQLARAKLGLSELALASSPVSEADKCAALVAIAADLAERISDLAMLAALGEQMAQREDARCTLLIGGEPSDAATRSITTRSRRSGCRATRGAEITVSTNTESWVSTGLTATNIGEADDADGADPNARPFVGSHPISRCGRPSPLKILFDTSSVRP